jgi:hypothetical protein
MKAFLSTIFIQYTVAEYEIFQTENKFKAILTRGKLFSQLPIQLTFWKENGRWKTSDSINEHVLYQFGNNIDNHILQNMAGKLKKAA